MITIIDPSNQRPEPTVIYLYTRINGIEKRTQVQLTKGKTNG